MDLKTSLLVNRQVPEFIRDEYPLFVSFLEAYYEFLETERFKTVDGQLVSQKNNLIEKLKDLRYVSDIDFSLGEFEDQFFNSFISYLPKETLVSKDFLIKNVLPLYQAKGTQKSFELLFRLLFGEEIRIEYPREQILRASSGRWVIENILRTETNLYNEYISDGIKSTYLLPYVIEPEFIEVYVDNQLKIIEEDYYIRKESKKVIFKNIPNNNSVIKIFYTGIFDSSIFNNRQIIGKTSGAKTLVEQVRRKNIAGSNFYQFFISDKNTVGTFQIGEIVQIDIIVDHGIIPFSFQTISDIDTITVVDQGSNYNIGDSVIIRGSSEEEAKAIVETISSGRIESLNIKVGNYGAGYKLDNEVYANGYNSNVFSAVIDAVDGSGTVSPNTIFFNNTDYISDYLSITLSDSDYGFPSNVVPSENLSTVISDALTLDTVTNLGPAINVVVTLSQIRNNLNVNFTANSTTLFDNVRVSDLGSIGTIRVISGGQGYSVGDQLVFTNTEYFSGQGAKAFVSGVFANGSIRSVTVENGGTNYRKDYLPVITVDSVGTGANLAIQHFMGEGVDFTYVPGDGISGKVLSIKVLNPGKGYKTSPIADLKFSGDGNASANIEIRPSLEKLPGRWTTSDGMISSDEIRLQGRDYYIDFSYVISSQIEFQRYKSIVKNLLNPSGSINYAKFNIFDNVDARYTISPNTISVFDDFSRQLAGQVNVTSNSIFVDGNENVYFQLANTIGILNEGTYILVNSEIRIVNSIINNTSITVSEPYNYSANDQYVTILVVPYNAITTEYWRELAITLEGPRTIVLTTEE
jgi:hypothetical protein